jgi:TldD protein
MLQEAAVNIEEKIRDLVRRKDVDYLEIRIEDERVTSISISGKEVESVSNGRNLGGNARVLISGIWGFVYFNNLDELENKIESAISQAKTLKGIVKEHVSLAAIKPVEAVYVTKVIKDPANITLKEKIDLLMHYSAIALNADPHIINTRITYSEKNKAIYFVNSEGTYIKKDILDIGGSIISISSNGVEIQRTMVPFGSSNNFSVVENLGHSVGEAALLAVRLLNADVPKGGEYPVIIDPGLGGVFIHEAFGHLSEADFLSEDPKMREIMKIGNVFGSNILNVYDTGDIEGLRGAVAYDDEGVPAKKVSLIQEGFLSGHLHTRETAAKMKEEPTGNGRALSYKFPPIPRMRTTFIGNGRDKFEDFVKDIKYGVYAKGSFGGQTNGELFTFVAEYGYLIEDGKITKLLKNVSLSGNVFETLKNIVGIGDDFAIKDSGGGCGKEEQFPLAVSHGSPHVYISKAIIGGK